MGFCIGTNPATGDAYISGDGTACGAGEIAVYSQAEVQTVAAQSFPDIFNIDSAGGSQIALAILLVWAAGFIGRVLIRALRETDSPIREEES